MTLGAAESVSRAQGRGELCILSLVRQGGCVVVILELLERRLKWSEGGCESSSLREPTSGLCPCHLLSRVAASHAPELGGTHCLCA